MNAVVEEAVLSGDGWPSLEAYYDLGVTPWGMLPYQIMDTRNEIRSNYAMKEENLGKSLQAEQNEAENKLGGSAALTPLQKAERSISVVKTMMASREGLIEFNRQRLATPPGSELQNRNIDNIMADLRKLHDDAVPGAIDLELDLLTASLSLYVDLAAKDILQAKLDALNKARQAAVEQDEAYKSAIAFVSDVNKEVLSKYGAQMSKSALDLQKGISGKKSKVTIRR